jgi:hypothetical protein
MFRCINDGVTIVRPGYQRNGNMYVIWSDASSFTLFPISGKVYIWRSPNAYNPECLIPTVKQGGGSVMVWAPISSYSVGSIITLHARITQGSTWTGWVIRCIPWCKGYFRITMLFSKTTMPPFTQLQLPGPSWFEGHESELNFSFGQQNHQT